MNQKGFTLAELVIALALFSFVLLAMTTGVIQLYRIYSAGIAIRTTQHNARLISDELSRAAHDASVVMTTPGNLMTNYESDKICFFENSGAPSKGVMYYTVVQSASDPLYAPTIALHKAQLDNMDPQAGCPANPPSGAPDELVSSSNVSLLRFAAISPNVGGGISGPYVTTVSMTFAATSALDLTLIDTKPVGDGTNDFDCNGGQGSEYCSMTHLGTSSYTRRQKSL